LSRLFARFGRRCLFMRCLSGPLYTGNSILRRSRYCNEKQYFFGADGKGKPPPFRRPTLRGERRHFEVCNFRSQALAHGSWRGWNGQPGVLYSKADSKKAAGEINLHPSGCREKKRAMQKTKFASPCLSPLFSPNFNPILRPATRGHARSVL